MLSGRLALPVSADATIWPPAPGFVVATPKKPVLAVPGTWTMPSFFTVAASATTSVTEPSDADARSVFRPEKIGAGNTPAQPKLSCTSVGANAALGVRAIRNVCSPPWPGIVAGVLGDPVSALVPLSVV